MEVWGQEALETVVRGEEEVPGGEWAQMMEATLCNDLGALSHHGPMWKPPETLAGFRELWKPKGGRRVLGRKQGYQI